MAQKKALRPSLQTDSKNKFKESRLAVNKAIRRVLATKKLSINQKRLLINKKSALVAMFYRNFDSASAIEESEISRAMLEYIDATRTQTLHRRELGLPLYRAKGASPTRARWFPCCSKYPGTFPFCSPC